MPEIERPDLVATARELAPIVREAADEADRERRLPERVAQAMAKAGLYRTSVAIACGGYECDPVTTIKVIEAIAEVDGATGWNLMIGLEGAGIASGAVSHMAAEEVFLGNPTSILCGAVNPLGRARAVEGGWIVSGRWPYASGCHNANWFWGGATLIDDEGTPMKRPSGVPHAVQMLIPRADWEILDTWNVAGLRGSGSHDVQVSDVFVPAHRMTDIFLPPTNDSPLFRYPVISRLCYNKVGVATGIARSAIDAFIELANEKTPYLSRSLLRDRAQAQLAVAEAEALLRSGRAFLFEAIGEMWDEVSAGRQPSPELRVRQRLAASHAVVSAVKAVELVHNAAGATANFQSSPLERQFRDVHVVRAHVTVSPAFFETAGRALLGVPVDPGSY